jgi:multisubunit Na+/H+ antiporter MnhB subunit
MIKKAMLGICLLIIFLMVTAVLASSSFNPWEGKRVSRYYIENSVEKTGSSSIVSAIVWDFRGFDTMGEETVLFTATAGILTVMALGFARRKK